MLYRIWCSSKWYYSRSIWMGIFQPRIRLIDDFWLTILIDDFWLTIFDWRFWLTIFDWRFWLTIFDWRFWLTIFDWRFWLTIFDWRFLIDDFDWRFLIEFSNLESWTQYFYSLFSKDRSWRSELFGWNLCMLYRIWCSSKWYHSRSIWMGIFQPRKLNSVFYSLFSNDRSWRSELFWLKIMYVVQNLMLFKMIPLSINLNGNFPT